MSQSIVYTITNLIIPGTICTFYKCECHSTYLFCILIQRNNKNKFHFNKLKTCYPIFFVSEIWYWCFSVQSCVCTHTLIKFSSFMFQLLVTIHVLRLSLRLLHLFSAKKTSKSLSSRIRSSTYLIYPNVVK